MSKVRILSPRPQNSNHLYGGFNFVPKAGRKDRPERSAWPIREYTIRKIIKTEFVNTSFYRFLLLRIEEESPRLLIFTAALARTENRASRRSIWRRRPRKFKPPLFVVVLILYQCQNHPQNRLDNIISGFLILFYIHHKI